MNNTVRVPETELDKVYTVPTYTIEQKQRRAREIWASILAERITGSDDILNGLTLEFKDR